MKEVEANMWWAVRNRRDANSAIRLRQHVEMLARMGVKDELDSLRAERDQLREASEGESLALRGRVAEVEEQLASVIRAIELRLESDQEFIRALRIQRVTSSGS